MSVIIEKPSAVLPTCAKARLAIARVHLRRAAEAGERVVIYEVALAYDMSEYHFARRFREAFGFSPHAFYDEVRAARARDLLAEGQRAGVVARHIGLRRPAELRRMLEKRHAFASMADVPV